MALPLGVALALTVTATPAEARSADALPYLSADADVVVSVNVRHVLDSAAFRKHARGGLEAWLKKDPRGIALSLVGLDVEKDIARVTVAGPSGWSFRDDWLAIVQGRFPVDRIHPGADLAIRLRPSALAFHPYENVRIYEVRGQDQAGPTYAAFLDPQTLVVSPRRKRIKQAIHPGASKPPALNPDLVALLKDQDDRQAAWLAGVPDHLVNEELAGNPRLRNLFSAIRSFRGTARLTDGVQGELNIQTTEPRAAVRLRRWLELAIAGAIVAFGNDETAADQLPLLTGILRTAETSVTDTTLHVQATISPELVDRWVRYQKEKKGEPRSGPDGR